MRETDFIEQNKNKWTELEELLHEERKDPDKLSSLFIKVTDDLSYSRTFYPNRSVRVYLNNIAQQVFYRLYKNKKETGKQFIHFWKEELPQLVYEARRDLFFSLMVFIIAVMIGVVSSANDAHFPRVILGNDYVNMTLKNIKKGDPMAVYKKSGGVDMFLGITFNNVRVAFTTFLLGVFYAIGTVAMLIYNGIMIGTFQYFFYERGLFLPSFLSVWLHGTLEISSIIIAAGAGITMGKGLLFPGTYSRLQSFLVSARRGFKILIGIVPIIVLAAIIESFMTRYTNVPDPVKAGVIFLSLTFILGYFVWYPFVKSRKGFSSPMKEVKLAPSQDYKITFENIKSNGEILKDIFIFYKNNFGKLFRTALILAALSSVSAAILHFTSDTFRLKYRDWFFVMQFFNYDKIPWFLLVNTVTISLNIQIILRQFKKYFPGTEKKKTESYILNFLKIAFVVFLFNCVLFLNGFIIFLSVIVATPFLVLWMFIGNYKNKELMSSFSSAFSSLNTSLEKSFGLFIMLAVISIIYFFMIDSPLVYFYFEIINWNLSLSPETTQNIISFVLIFTSFTAIHLILPMLIIGFSFLYFSLKEIKEANELNRKIQLLANKTVKIQAI